MTANLWARVDTTREDKERINTAISVCREVLGEFQCLGYSGTEDKQKSLEDTIDTLEMIFDGDLF